MTMNAEEFVRSLLREDVDHVILSNVHGTLICMASSNETRHKLRDVHRLPSIARFGMRRTPAVGMGNMKSSVLQSPNGHIIQMVFGPLVLSFVLANSSSPMIGSVLSMRPDLEVPMAKLMDAHK